jgi:hypothetical protein
MEGIEVKDKLWNDLADYLSKNTEATMDGIKVWASENNQGLDLVHKKLIIMAVKFSRFWTGGKYGGNEPVDVKNLSLDEIAAGIKVEMEHTPDVDVALKIVLDHESESYPVQYYTGHLDKLEEQIKSEKDASNE